MYVLIFFAWNNAVLFLIALGALFQDRAASLMKVEHSTFVIPGPRSDIELEGLVLMVKFALLISHLVG